MRKLLTILLLATPLSAQSPNLFRRPDGLALLIRAQEAGGGGGGGVARQFQDAAAFRNEDGTSRQYQSESGFINAQ